MSWNLPRKYNISSGRGLTITTVYCAFREYHICYYFAEYYLLKLTINMITICIYKYRVDNRDHEKLHLYNLVCQKQTNMGRKTNGNWRCNGTSSVYCKEEIYHS